MKHATTQDLFAYWDGLRGERASPERGEIDPTAIRGVLADTFILEVDTDRGYPFRLSGTRLNALFTSDLKGRSFPGLFRQADRLDVVDLLSGVCDDVNAMVAGVSSAPAGREPIELELLLLPVRHLGKTHARMLGCLSPAVLPSWIGLLPLEALALKALRVLSAPPVPRRTGTAAIICGGTDADGRPRARHGHLFVHDGGLCSRNPVS